MKKIINKISKNNKSYLFIALMLLVVLVVFLVSMSFSDLLDNDTKVSQNSELTYYLNVSYDGVDKKGVKSDETKVSDINSGTLLVEDKLPVGLEFVDFVKTANGSIGAVKRSDKTVCVGKVIDDTKEESVDTGVWNNEHTEYTYHGLHYNAETRTVSFKVKNLKAGCELTVGIVTRTPPVDDPSTPTVEIRRDFYNFATAGENDLVTDSNTVHVYIGNDFIVLHNVTYEFTGDVPPNVEPPTSTSYVTGSKVAVASDIKLEGYTFDGWSSEDVTITDGEFTMPDRDITIKGSFTPVNTSYKVTYTLDGDLPEGYVLPSEKSYYTDTVVDLDSLAEGDTFNGYRFLGWLTEDAEITEDGDFVMPSKDVTLVGRFEKIKYKVIYQFYDNVLPPNANDYLPAIKEYYSGDTVTLDTISNIPNGYEFLGWYSSDGFEMPEEDVIIYGEWKVQLGTFEPTISKEIINNNKDYYRVGDIIEFKITVTNTAAFAIKEVVVNEENSNSTFKSGNGYSIISEHVASIDQLAANSSVDLYASYTVQPNDKGTITNTVKIKGALADNNYQLVDKEYIANASFKIQSKIKICKEVTSSYNENTFQFHITGNTNHYETWISLEKDQCDTIFVDPSTYKIKEVVPQEYTIKSVSGAITANNANLTVEEGHDYEITYTNEFVKKGFFHSFDRIVNRIVQGGN